MSELSSSLQARAAEIRAATGAIMAIAETIRELGEVPSGHLYAMLMSRMSLGTYESTIGILKRAGLVGESAHLLKWIGPKLEDK